MLLLVKVARDGTVADVAAEQVNMAVVASERTLAKMRDILARASVSTARTWTFAADHRRGQHPDSWTVRIPVNFALNHDPNAEAERYGRWRAFIPGPRQACRGTRLTRSSRPAAICCRKAASTWWTAPSAACAC